jgi:DNA repair exonuclease SbcCD nuclease subunit
VKVLHTGDWHGDRSTAGVARFKDVERAAYETMNFAMKEGVDLYIHTGDLADPDGGALTLRNVELAMRVATTLRADGIWNLWMPGNHDVSADGAGTSTLTPLAALDDEPGSKTIVCERPRWVSVEGTKVVALPYPVTARPYDPMEFVEEFLAKSYKEGDRVIVAGHMTELAGIEAGEETNEMARGRGVPFPLAQCRADWLLCNGHWHRQQDFQSMDRVVRICGSLARLTFGEEGHRPSFNVYEI